MFDSQQSPQQIELTSQPTDSHAELTQDPSLQSPAVERIKTSTKMPTEVSEEQNVGLVSEPTNEDEENEKPRKEEQEEKPEANKQLAGGNNTVHETLHNKLSIVEEDAHQDLKEDKHVEDEHHISVQQRSQ